MANFQQSPMKTDDPDCSDRSNSAVVPENVNKVHEVVLEYQKVWLRKVPDILKILEGSVRFRLWSFLKTAR